MCGFASIFADNLQNNIKSTFAKTILARGTSFCEKDTVGLYAAYARLPTDAVNNKNLNNIVKPGGQIFMFNGLMTNVHELCVKFKLNNKAFLSDTECMRQGFAKYGVNFLEAACGMFAMGLIMRKKCVLVRDTVGIKPLYYVYNKNKKLFAFASEIKSLTTLKSKVIEVLPGQIIYYNSVSNSISKSNYAYKPQKTFVENSLSNLKQLLTQSIVEPTRRYLLQSSKNVAILLSGGLDSSLCTSILLKNLKQSEVERLRFYTLKTNNSSDARVVAKLIKKLGIVNKHKFVTLPSETQIKTQLRNAVFELETSDPRTLKVGIMYMHLARIIKQDAIDIVISSEGADELFYGYKRFIKPNQAQTERLFNNFYSNVFYKTLLKRYDRAFARACIEGRVPFLDQELVFWAEHLPYDDKIKVVNGVVKDKYILRELAKELGLPKYVYARPKIPMTQGVTGKHNYAKSNVFMEDKNTKFKDVLVMYYSSAFGKHEEDLVC